MTQYDIFKPDRKWSEYTAGLIVRMSKIDPSAITRVEINCGSGSNLGWVITNIGERVRV